MNRDQLIAALRETANEKPRSVETKWGTVYVKSLTVGEVDAQTDDTADGKDKNRIARAVARILCDENGERMFNPDDPADIALLAKQPWKLLRTVITDPDEGN